MRINFQLRFFKWGTSRHEKGTSPPHQPTRSKQNCRLCIALVCVSSRTPMKPRREVVSKPFYSKAVSPSVNSRKRFRILPKTVYLPV